MNGNAYTTVSCAANAMFSKAKAKNCSMPTI